MSEAVTIQTDCAAEVELSAEFITQVAELESLMLAFEMGGVDEGNVQDAAALLKQSSQLRSKAERDRKALAAPFNAASRKIKAAVDARVQPLILVDQVLKRAVASYEAKRRAAERKATEEAAQKERDAAEAEVAIQSEMDELFGGDVGLTEATPVTAMPVMAPPKPRNIATSERIEWDESEADIDRALSSWLRIHKPAVNAHLREHKPMILKKMKEANLQPGDALEYHGLKLRLILDIRAR